MRYHILSCLLVAGIAACRSPAPQVLPLTGDPNAPIMREDSVEVRPAVVRGSCKPPTYPASMRRAHVAGHVVVAYIVGTDGRVERGSLEVVEASHPDFIPPTIDVVRSCRFTPGRVGNRLVRVRVTQPINYDIQGR